MKKPYRGRQIAGGSLPKSSQLRWDLFTIEDDTGWVPPLQLLKITGIGTIAGGNFVCFPLAICIKKSAKGRVHHPPPPTVFLLFADFFTELTGPKYNITRGFWPRVRARLFGLIATPNGAGRARGPPSSISPSPISPSLIPQSPNPPSHLLGQIDCSNIKNSSTFRNYDRNMTG